MQQGAIYREWLLTTDHVQRELPDMALSLLVKALYFISLFSSHILRVLVSEDYQH
jgi:hypothetical protein